jgi:hypothetical protein
MWMYGNTPDDGNLPQDGDDLPASSLLYSENTSTIHRLIFIIATFQSTSGTKIQTIILFDLLRFFLSQAVERKRKQRRMHSIGCFHLHQQLTPLVRPPLKLILLSLSFVVALYHPTECNPSHIIAFLTMLRKDFYTTNHIQLQWCIRIAIFSKILNG